MRPASRLTGGRRATRDRRLRPGVLQVGLHRPRPSPHDARGGVAQLPPTTPGSRSASPADSVEPRSCPNQMRLDLTSRPSRTSAAGGAGPGARWPAHRRRPAPGGGARRARRPGGQRVLRHRAGQRLPRRLRLRRRARRATARRRSATSGARRWAGRWSGTRTRRPRSARRTAARRSPGPVRPSTPKTGDEPAALDLAPGRRRPAGGGRPAASPSGRPGSTSAQGVVSWVVLADPDGNEFCARGQRRGHALSRGGRGAGRRRRR